MAAEAAKEDGIVTPDELKQIILDAKGAGVRTLKGTWKDGEGQDVSLDLTFERGPAVSMSQARRTRARGDDE